MKKAYFWYFAMTISFLFLGVTRDLHAGTFTARTGTSGSYHILDEDGEVLANGSLLEIYAIRSRSDLAVTAGSPVAISASGTFQYDLLSPGKNIEILEGPNQGSYEIASVDSDNQVTFTRNITSTAADISYVYDSLIKNSFIGKGFILNSKPGEFIDSNVNVPGGGEPYYLFLRAYNDADKTSATYYGDSNIVSLDIGEIQVGIVVTFTPAYDNIPLQTSIPIEYPTIQLVYLNAAPEVGAVRLEWITSIEPDVQGFNIYRALDPEDEYVQINSQAIPGQGSDEAGASYEYTDTGTVPGVAYYYLIESVDWEDGSQLHGPVSAIPQDLLPGLVDETGGAQEVITVETVTRYGYGCGDGSSSGAGYLPLIGGLFFLGRKGRKKRR